MRTRFVIARSRGLVAALAVVLIGATAAAADAAPRWKFKPGESLNYVLERNADGQMKLAGNPIGIKMGMTFDTTWKCTAVADDGAASLEQTVDRIQISMDSPLSGEIKFDSAAGAAPGGPLGAMLGPMINGLLGQPIKLKVSPLGAVSDIELPAKLQEEFAKQNEVGQNRRAGMGIGGNAFSEDAIKKLVEQAMLPLPETAEAGTTWTQAFENELPMLGTELAETTFSLGPEETVDGKKLLKIEAKTELLFEPAEDARMEMEIIEQASSATAYFDTEAGHLVKSEGTQKAVKELSGQQEISQDITETFKMYLGKSPAPVEAKTEEKPAAK
ncbi:MAG: DUF6263 family protein [Pirellulales bacterium]